MTTHNTSNAFLLGQYVLNRIAQNAHTHQMHINPFKLGDKNEVLWHIVYFLVYRAFLNGDTLYWFDTTPQAFRYDVRLGIVAGDFADVGAVKLPIGVAWQGDVLIGLCREYQAYFEDDTTTHFGWLPQVCQALLGLDGQALVAEARRHRDEFLGNLDKIGIAKSQADHLKRLVHLALRWVYLIKNDWVDLSDFYQAMTKHPLFLVVDDNLLKAVQQAEKPLLISECEPKGFGVWLNRAFVAEYWLAFHLKRLLSFGVALPKSPIQMGDFANGLSDEQNGAILFAKTHPFTMITGGPGTGKTFTVAQLVLQLLDDAKQKGDQKPPVLALTAPTGKAAQRMQESLQKALESLGASVALPEATTIHRLIGLKDAGKPLYHADNPILADVVIVDEASMLGIELACQLLASIKTGAKVVLLGDVNQLSAVEAGAVLADLCALPALNDCHKKLTVSRRFDDRSAIGQLARFVNANEQTNQEQYQNRLTAWYELFERTGKAVSYHTVGYGQAFLAVYGALVADFYAFFAECANVFGKMGDDNEQFATTKQQLFAQFYRYRILTATHLGAFGDNTLNAWIADKHRAYYVAEYPNELLLHHKEGEWYHGRAVMIVKNHYKLGLFNGDVGICLGQVGERGVEFWVHFEQQDTPVPISLLSQEGLIVSAYAMTIHKSQGSEFEKVAICLLARQGEQGQGLFGRELLYTAITRAKETVMIYSNDETIGQMLTHKTERNTGFGRVFGRLGNY